MSGFVKKIKKKKKDDVTQEKINEFHNLETENREIFVKTVVAYYSVSILTK